MLYDIESVKNHTLPSSPSFIFTNPGDLFEKFTFIMVALAFGYYTGQKNNL